MKTTIALLCLALCGCHPNLPPVSDCTPFVQSCLGNAPHVCSSSRRWEPSGDLSCNAVHGVCVVLPDGRAGCSVSDAGVGGDL